MALAGFLVFLAGTSIGSPLLHAVSIAVFYWGSVLYLAGTRTFVATIPAGLVVISIAFPLAFGTTGLLYVDGLSWALFVTSLALLQIRKKSPPPAPCAFCTSFKEKGRSFCSSCGRHIAPLAAPSSRKLYGFAIFTVAALALLTITVPVLVASPTVSLDNYGIGGPQATNHFAPLPGWGARTAPLKVNGTLVDRYSLTSGRIAMQALIAEASDPVSAADTLNSTRVGAVPDTSFPPSISNSMSGYTLTVGGTEYVGLDGVFNVQLLNQSTLSMTYVAIDLRQTSASFAQDNGLSLYNAALDVINWASGSANWSSVSGTLLSIYQVYSQVAAAVSFGGVGVVLFTVARDDELTKSRRLESMYSLGSSEQAVLEAFGSGTRPTKGDLLLASVWRSKPWISDSVFFSSLDELVRRDLVSPSVVIEKGWPTLYWKRMV